ncbi:MAG TPA: thioredoxin domain-containing protein [Bryobacteraceae bacterium]
MDLKLSSAVCAVILVCSASASQVQPCRPFTPQQKTEVETFVQQWFKLPPTQTVSVVDSSTVDSACYRKLVFRASVPAPLLTLYLAPDGKHLISGFMDLRVDPVVAQHKMQEQLNARLTANAFLTSADSTAPIKMVVFADFQCPYCRRFFEIVQQLTGEERSKVQIIYRQSPLNIHAWAHNAAELTECVALQDKGAFWKLHDFLFADQEEISTENLQSKVLDFLSHKTTVSSKAVLACMNEKRFEAPLQQDEQLAMDLGINVTPSVFINGRRTIIRSIKDLRTALESARPERADADILACSSKEPKLAGCVKRSQAAPTTFVER